MKRTREELKRKLSNQAKEIIDELLDRHEGTLCSALCSSGLSPRSLRAQLLVEAPPAQARIIGHRKVFLARSVSLRIR